MKALVLTEVNKFEYKDVPDPKPGRGEVVIDVRAVSICGSDVHGYDGSSGRRQPPLIVGHEASGVISETGGEVKDFKVGDRVVFNSSLYCRDCWYCKRGMLNMCADGKVYGVGCDSYRLEGAMCERIVVPEYILYKIPDSLPFEQAALIEPVSIAMHAINGADIKLNDNIVVFGSGTIGLMMLKLLRCSSAGRIAVVDVDLGKLELAKSNGADIVIDGRGDVVSDIRKWTNGLGADFAFEAVGVTPTIVNAMNSLRKGGTLIQVGNVAPKVDFPLQKLVMSELRVLGRYGTGTEYETSIDMLANGKISVDDCLSVVAPLTEGQKWFDKLHAAEPGLIKVVLKP